MKGRSLAITVAGDRIENARRALDQRHATEKAAVAVGLDLRQLAQVVAVAQLGTLEAVAADDPQPAAIDRKPFDVHLAVAAVRQVEHVGQWQAAMRAIALGLAVPEQLFHRRVLIGRAEQRVADACQCGDVVADGLFVGGRVLVVEVEVDLAYGLRRASGAGDRGRAACLRRALGGDLGAGCGTACSHG